MASTRWSAVVGCAVLGIGLSSGCEPEPVEPAGPARVPPQTTPSEPTDPVEPGSGDTDVSELVCGSGAVLELGVGVQAHEPIEPDMVVVLRHGPQGGWHVDTSGLLTGSGQLVQIVYELAVPELGYAVVGENANDPWSVALAEYDELACSGAFFGMQSRLAPLPPEGFDTPDELVCWLEGREVELSVRVTDLVTGRVAEGEATVGLELDPFDVGRCP